MMLLMTKARAIIVFVILCMCLVHLYLLRDSNAPPPQLQYAPPPAVAAKHLALTYRSALDQRHTSLDNKIPISDNVETTTSSSHSNEARKDNVQNITGQNTRTWAGQLDSQWINRQQPDGLQSLQSPGDEDGDFSTTSVLWMKDLEEMDQFNSHQMSADYSFLENLNDIGVDLEEEQKQKKTDYSFIKRLNVFVQDLTDIDQQVKESSKTQQRMPVEGQAKINRTVAAKPKKEKMKAAFRLPINLSEVKQRYSKTTRNDVPEELYRLAPDVFDNIPPPDKFLDEFKSPCWRDDNLLQCLPSFYLAGMPKCGTSDVWAKVNAHNGVHATRKEPHWWTRHRIGKLGSSHFQEVNSTGHIKLMSLEDYLDRYALMAEVMDTVGENIIAGDGSASTFWDNGAWEAYYPKYFDKGPPYVIGDVIHAITPKAKIIVILRNPVDRLYSSYWYFWERSHPGTHPSNKAFHELVACAISEIEQCLQHRSMRACSYSLAKDPSTSRLGVTAGFYDVFIQDWLKAFPREQLLVLRLEDWSMMCKSVLPRIFNFWNLVRESNNRVVIVELTPLSTHSIKVLCKVKASQNKGSKGQDMLPETRTLLEEIYKPHLQNLAKLFEESKWYWGMVPG
ncbi:uncharacterized protein [Amphiura filiformis]|uniref:uncharacterized protein n=1 Tax=Amphiura filiformis TaxID=82378 RepID=UPI003B2273DB